jgi:catechol 2,3-dioxygenase-like lactoylglutathione lyase family enzyme
MSSAGAADGGDRCWTHVALPVSDVAASIAFYQRWTNLTLYETVADSGGAKAARLGDAHLGFVLVLIEGPDPVSHALDGFGHLGIECGSRDQVARLSDEADQAGCLRLGPIDSGPPRGYWAVLTDPDGHQLELSHGQHNLPDH